MHFLQAVRLALETIRVQKLKSFFTLIGVTIGVTFLIAVVSIVGGMSRYMQDDLVGKLIAVNSFNLRRTPDLQMGDVTEAERREWRRRPRVLVSDVPVVAAARSGGSCASRTFRTRSSASPRNRAACSASRSTSSSSRRRNRRSIAG